ncbi:MAG: cyclase family protein [Chloroflexota bacterium]
MSTQRTLVDLSHPVVSGEVGWIGLPAPRIEPWMTHEASRVKYGGKAEFEITHVSMVGNAGTYLDAPRHRIAGASDIAGLPLELLAGLPGAVLDGRPAADGRRVDLDGVDLTGVRGHAVLVRTGWDARRGTDGYFTEGPFLSARATERLVAAGVLLLGTDAANVDDAGDPSRPAHTGLLGAGIPIVEHLRGLGPLPARGFRFFAVPAPVRDAVTWPVRAFAEIGGDAAS